MSDTADLQVLQSQNGGGKAGMDLDTSLQDKTDKSIVREEAEASLDNAEQEAGQESLVANLLQRQLDLNGPHSGSKGRSL